ncbi:MAG: hypothetical protein WD044_08060 [Dongiaceae bacterium]
MTLSTRAETLLRDLDIWLKQAIGDARVERDDAPAGAGGYVMRVPPGERRAFFHPVDWEEFSAVLVGIGVLIPRAKPEGGMVPEWSDRKSEEVGFRIVAGPDARFLPGGPAFGALALVGLWGNRKIQISAIDREQRRVLMVVKSTGYRDVVPALKNEAAALGAIAGRCPAPSMLGQGDLPRTGGEAGPSEAADSTGDATDSTEGGALTIVSESWLPGTPLSGLRWEPDPVIGSLEQTLSGLVQHDRPTSLAALGAKLSLEAEALWIEPRERENLLKIIGTLSDTTPVPSSRTHGDLEPQNILVGPGGAMSLLNWEFSRADGLGVTDLIRFAVNPRFTLATSFADFLDSRATEMLRRIQKGSLPGAVLPLGQLLALQFCTHFIDRIRAYPRKAGVRMITLAQLIESEWTLANAPATH